MPGGGEGWGGGASRKGWRVQSCLDVAGFNVSATARGIIPSVIKS